MIRILFFFLVLAALAFGGTWLIEHDQPGAIQLSFQGRQYSTSLVVGIAAVIALALAAGMVWSLLRFIFKIPSLLSLASRARRRNNGLAALSRGMVAAGAGDARLAQRASSEADRLLPSEPLTYLLRAQAAQLSGDRSGAEAAFSRMLERPETRVLGLRGLHMEARRRGDTDAAHHFASQAHQIAALPWASQAVLDNRTGRGDWQGALDIVESNLAARTIDRKTASRQRAVLQTAMAQDKSGAEPDAALALAREALKRAPGLVPAAALAGRLLARKGDIRKASKVLEAAWAEGPHPDIARVYLDVRPGDSTSDRLSRARTLARLKPRNIESQLVVAKAGLDARDFAGARRAMDDAFAIAEQQDGDTRPTARMCLMMAQIEDVQHGATGPVREWLAKASRARRDPAWIADGTVSDTWAPVSPVTGALDAFEWRSPAEQLSAPVADWRPAAELPRAMVEVEHVAVAAAPPPAAIEFAAAVPETAVLASAPAPPVALRTRPPGPVVFPHPAAPDDPGPDAPALAPPKRYGFLARD